MCLKIDVNPGSSGTWQKRNLSKKILPVPFSTKSAKIRRIPFSTMFTLKLLLKIGKNLVDRHSPLYSPVHDQCHLDFLCFDDLQTKYDLA